MDNFNFTELYDNNNSGLETLLTSDYEYESVRISDIEFDENGDFQLNTTNLGKINITKHQILSAKECS